MNELLKFKTLFLAVIVSTSLLSINAKGSDEIIPEEEIIPAITRLSNLFLIPPMRAKLGMTFGTGGFQLDYVDVKAEIIMTEEYRQELYKNENYSEITTIITAGKKGVVGNTHLFGENFLIDGVVTFADLDGKETPLEIEVIVGERVLFHFFMKKIETKFVGLSATKEELVISGQCVAKSELIDSKALLNDNKVITSKTLMKECGYVYRFNKESKKYEFKLDLDNQ